MLKIKLEGFENFKKLLLSHAKGDLNDLKVVIYNTCEYVTVLEYGSVPGQKPWPNSGEKTEMGIDIFSGAEKIFSTQGFAMLRGNEEKAKKMLEKNLSKIKLNEDIRPQVIKALNNAGAYWLREAIVDTPVDTTNASRSWNIIKA